MEEITCHVHAKLSQSKKRQPHRQPSRFACLHLFALLRIATQTEQGFPSMV